MVYNIIKNPFWIVPRNYPPNDIPIDLAFYTRENSRLKSLKSTVENNRGTNARFYSNFSSQGEICIDLFIDPGSSDPVFVTITDRYLPAIEQGKINVLKCEILEFTENHIVVSKNDEIINIECDAVIFCTGFEPKLDFLSEEIKKSIDYNPKDLLQPILLHKCTFTTYSDNLAFVGIYRGPYFAIMELQAR